ncbi:hypothetical protein M407DRAFT_14242 [Tulasnella calospora MUT 4182]|uniref:RING-type domain-containing protein n=1 Tax=Tulasnella calospora MUT 4182 TaxID=1051891 RepID=A0A0C3LA58_9AGAM|nr:hypothetical protein M407DRAFT_14242 [Tulasnella calospora MUT 4182]
MFDEYVEHASAPPGRSQANYGLPNVKYEGFEPNPFEEDPMSPNDSSFPAGISQPPIFELGRVQYTLPAPLVHMESSSYILTMAFSNNTLRQLNLRQPDAVASITLTTKKSPSELTIYRTFMDPTGKHTIITTEQGDNFYAYDGWTKARPLAKFRMVIESVAWNEGVIQGSSTTNKAASTREILIGARNGTIYESVIDAHDDFFKSQDRYLNALFTLPDKQPIYGVKFETYSSPDAKSRRGAVLVTTATRIYEFQGALDKKGEDSGKLFEPLFEPYRAQSGTTPPKFIEIPGHLARSELRFYTPAPTLKGSASTSRQLGWLTGEPIFFICRTFRMRLLMPSILGSGAYRGTVPLPPTSDNLIDSASLLHYPSSSDVPISMCLSEFHFIFLFRDRICAVSNLDERLVWEENLPLKPNETALGLTSDPKSGTYWLFTDAALFELVLKDEDRDVWSVYLKQDSYDLALKYSKTAPHRAQVYSAYAKHQFDQGNYISAAQSYAQSATSFEQITLAFLDLGEQGRDGLRSYLYARLERCGKGELTQRMLLATWLVEFYLSKINTLDDIIASEGASHDVDNLKAEQALLEDELRSFFDTYKANLDKKTVYDLILNHGREDVFLYYATVVGDFEKVLEHHIMDEAWLKAVDVLNRQINVDLYYRFSPVLMQHAPKEIVDSWLRQPALDPIKLIPALLQQQNQLTPQSPLSSNQAIRYLQHVVFTARSTSPTIHNLLLTLLVTSSVKRDNSTATPAAVEPSSIPAESDLPLLRFLSTAPVDPITARPYYDLDYALRLCKQHNRLQACVHIYAKMAMWEESVDLALEMGDLELAKVNCERATEDATTAGASGDEGLRKRLWLKVAKFVVQEQNDIKTAMRLLDNTPLVKIEDILPFFPDFVVIDDFKEEICNALESYSAHIDALKADMDEATKSAEAIKNDIKNLQNRFVTLEASEKCSICGLNLLTRQFYVFPCQHCFHADCLIGQVKEYLPAPALRRLITLQNNLKTDAEAKAEKIRDELDDMLASSCPLCEGVVVGLDKPFIAPGEVDDSWAL